MLDLISRIQSRSRGRLRLEAMERELDSLRTRCREQELSLDERAAEIRSLTDALLLAAGGHAVFNPALNEVQLAKPLHQPTARRFPAWQRQQELHAARDYIASLRAPVGQQANPESR